MRDLKGNKKHPRKPVTLGFTELDTNPPLVHTAKARKETYFTAEYTLYKILAAFGLKSMYIFLKYA